VVVYHLIFNFIKSQAAVPGGINNNVRLHKVLFVMCNCIYT
jgi:hypothetical protein